MSAITLWPEADPARSPEPRGEKAPAAADTPLGEAFDILDLVWSVLDLFSSLLDLG